MMKKKNEICLCFKSRMLARSITKFYDKCMQPSDLKSTQFSMLVDLSEYSGLGLTDLSEIYGMDRSTVTRNMSLLQKKGLVESKRDVDERRVIFSLTPLGQSIISKSLPYWENSQEYIKSFFKENGSEWENDYEWLKNFNNHLNKLSQNLHINHEN